MRRMLLLICCAVACTITFAQKDCRNAEYEDNAISAHPEIRNRLAYIESFTYNNTGDRKVILSGETGSSSLPAVITIPVVVHILYNTDNQNLSEKQILSQIDILNKDFRSLNADKSNIPGYFTAFAADCGIEFKLAKTDPRGFSTTGVVRRKTSILNFGMDDRAKYTSQGGDDAWDADKYLNIWVCPLAGGVIGYSSSMGGDPATDGVVINSFAFGIGSGNNESFNKGRTATHEIGHWLNLRHIWGDASCGDDKVDDTPSQRSANRGCPSGKKVSCATTPNGDMYMNYMDLTNDQCMYMFTNGQRERMRSLFLPGGARRSILNSNALAVSLLPQPGVVLQDNSAALTIYPNPVASSFTLQVEASAGTEGIVFIIYNHIGQPVQRCVIKGKINTINVSSLADGIYYIKPADGSVKKAAKFIKIK